jgi:excisionase family DNA binding protein
VFLVYNMDMPNSRKNVPAIDPERVLLKVPEVARKLGFSRSAVYGMMASGELPTVRRGRSVRVSVRALEKWLKERGAFN